MDLGIELELEIELELGSSIPIFMLGVTQILNWNYNSIFQFHKIEK